MPRSHSAGTAYAHRRIASKSECLSSEGTVNCQVPVLTHRNLASDEPLSRAEQRAATSNLRIALTRAAAKSGFHRPGCV